jgi:ureidoglycolate hydrolase
LPPILPAPVPRSRRPGSATVLHWRKRCIMRLIGRGLSFDRMARHDRVTQCLGTTDGLPWLIAVAPAGIAAPTIADIRAFRIPADQFIALAHGTWHAGPYFSEPRRDFYNLELTDTNKADFTVCHLQAPVAFVG